MYLAFTASALQTRLVYRGQVWASVFGQLVQVFAKVAIWMSIYAGIEGLASGVSLSEMITYAILGGVVLTGWSWDGFVREVDTQIRTGDVSVFLLKPLSYPLMLLAAEAGNASFRLLAVVLPVALIGTLFYGIVPPASFFHGAMYVVFVLVGFLILFAIALLAGLLAFWLLTAFSLEWLMNGLFALLSGVLVPLWFYPPVAAQFIVNLPFAFVAYHPMAVYLGRNDVAGTLTTLGVGLGWLILLGLAAAWLWRRAARRIVVQGG